MSGGFLELAKLGEDLAGEGDFFCKVGVGLGNSDFRFSLLDGWIPFGLSR